jgi:GT2 family glycosyltransferase
MDTAPIVLFVYNRSDHASQTLEALSANDLADQSTLFIYSDGPKPQASEDDIQKINSVRQLIKSKKWCKEVHIIESAANLGLAVSFVRGVTEVVNRYGKVIVLEDDQLTGKGFLRYMNEALELYKDDEKVMHVSGYMYPAKTKSKKTTMFLSVQSCPGWGTWKRAWEHFNPDAADHVRYFSKSKKLIKKFNLDGHAFFFEHLKRNAEEKNYSFAVLWYASCIRAGGLSLFPARSLVKNNGFDGSGVHCTPWTKRLYDVETVDYLEIEKIKVVEDKKVRKSIDLIFKEHFFKKNHDSIRKKLKSSLRKMGAGKVKHFIQQNYKRII